MLFCVKHIKGLACHNLNACDGWLTSIWRELSFNRRDQIHHICWFGKFKDL